MTVPPTSVCAWRITSGPCTVPCRCTVGGLTAYAAPSPPSDDRRDRDRGQRAAPAELAAVLRVLEPQAREQRVPEELRRDPADRVEPERPAERRHQVEPAHRARRRDRARARRAAARATPAGRRARGGRRATSSTSPIASISATSSIAHQRCSASATSSAGSAETSARLDAAGQRVRHTRLRKPWAAYFAPAIVSAAGNAHCAATPASESVRVSSVSAATVESGVEHDPAVVRREVVRVDEVGEQRVVAEALAGSRSRRSPVREPFGECSTRKRPSRSAARTGSSHAAPAG